MATPLRWIKCDFLVIFYVYNFEIYRFKHLHFFDMQISNKCDFFFRFQIRYWLSEPRAPSGGGPQPIFYNGARVGPIWAVNMGPTWVCPRVPCGPQPTLIYGPHMGYTRAAWVPCGHGLKMGNLCGSHVFFTMWVPYRFAHMGPSWDLCGLGLG